MVGCIGYSLRSRARCAFSGLLLSLSSRRILLKLFMTRISSGGSRERALSRKKGNKRSPSAMPLPQIAALNSAILIEKGVGISKVLPPDDVTPAGLSEKKETGRYCAVIHIKAYLVSATMPALEAHSCQSTGASGWQTR